MRRLSRAASASRWPAYLLAGLGRARGANGAEKSVTQTGRIDAINHIRHLFQKTMEAEFREAVERLTGREVLALIGGNHIDSDVAAELFILDGPPASPTRPPNRQSASTGRSLNSV